MKKLLLSLVIIAIFLGSFSLMGKAEAATRVRSYIRSNGTYVMPYYRSTRNSTKLDNWSTRGNYNPYTGSRGYKRIY
jgi:hypothetical protein